MPAGALLLASPTSLDVVRKAEATLGFNLPPLLIQVYTEVVNGGFGPGYGLLGLAGGFADDLGDTAVQSYLRRRADQSLQWRDALLPICHWRRHIREKGRLAAALGLHQTCFVVGGPLLRGGRSICQRPAKGTLQIIA
jgi:hypothetical protein